MILEQVTRTIGQMIYYFVKITESLESTWNITRKDIENCRQMCDIQEQRLDHLSIKSKSQFES